MIRTRNGLPKYCSYNRDRHGVRRVRFRKNGFTTYIPGAPWSAEFMVAYAAALDNLKGARENIGHGRTKPGSVNALAVAWYRSPEFLAARISTQRQRKSILEGFRRQYGDNRVDLLNRQHVKAIMAAKANTPAAANNLLKVLRLLFDCGVDRGMMTTNPAVGIKLFKLSSEGIHTWSEVEIERFESCHPYGTKARLAFELLLGTAQRVSDVVRAGWQHIKGETIIFRQQKTGVTLEIPIHPSLAKALAMEPKDNFTFVLTEWGGPFSSNGFSHWFRKRCDDAGLRQCSAHGLRKATATRLADAGCTADQIKAITGHRSLNEVARYTQKADQKRLAKQAIAAQIRSEHEQELSNRHSGLDKSQGK